MQAGFQFPELIGKWDLTLSAYVSPIKWNSYFGMGNKTMVDPDDYAMHTFKSVEYGAIAGFRRQMGKSAISLQGLYHVAKARQDTSGYAYKNIDFDTAFSRQQYAGASVGYQYKDLNNAVLPTRGFYFDVNAGWYHHINLDKDFKSYTARLNFYVPLSKKLSIAVKSGGKTLAGDASHVHNIQTFQHAIIGGAETLRGYRANRYWGKSAYYNQNELRFMTDLRTHLLNAKIGALVFADNGRVWIPGETFNKTHTSWGGGVIFAPFYKVNCVLTYGISEEDKLLQFTMTTGL